MNVPLFMYCPESFVYMLHWAKQHSVFSLFAHLTMPCPLLFSMVRLTFQFCSKVLDLTCFSQCWLCVFITVPFLVDLSKNRGQNLVKNNIYRKLVKLHRGTIRFDNINYCIVASTNTCYYSENQVFGGVTIRILCSKRGGY